MRLADIQEDSRAPALVTPIFSLGHCCRWHSAMTPDTSRSGSRDGDITWPGKISPFPVDSDCHSNYINSTIHFYIHSLYTYINPILYTRQVQHWRCRQVSSKNLRKLLNHGPPQKSKQQQQQRLLPSAIPVMCFVSFVISLSHDQFKDSDWLKWLSCYKAPSRLGFVPHAIHLSCL